MNWPTIDEISAILPLSSGYRYEILARSGIPALIDGIRQWHPHIAVVEEVAICAKTSTAESPTD